jgi:hypothetical protein
MSSSSSAKMSRSASANAAKLASITNAKERCRYVFRKIVVTLPHVFLIIKMLKNALLFLTTTRQKWQHHVPVVGDEQQLSPDPHLHQL